LDSSVIRARITMTPSGARFSRTGWISSLERRGGCAWARSATRSR
jgi:hypothetical protein